MRPRALDPPPAWHLGMVPKTLEVDGHRIKHPAWRCAIFAVHGMGQPQWAATAARMRSGLEDAIDSIEKWQRSHDVGPIAKALKRERIVAPYILDGYWGNYPDLEGTFPEEWSRLAPDQREFFNKLWRLRVVSTSRTYWWLLWQQVRLLRLRVLTRVPIAWLLYVPLQLVSLLALTLAVIQRPRVLTKFLTDVRLYLDPRGSVEAAIVQRIDRRVGEAFLRMLGLGWDFRPLLGRQLLMVGNEPIRFDRVVWVAHSLGSVISYNVLSDLFGIADELDRTGDEEQRRGVARFRHGLRRFVTFGSPLDKVAFLFETDTVRPWSADAVDKMQKAAWSTSRRQGKEDPEWWVNFFHNMDPVSGALSSPLICHARPPKNLHASGWNLPGFAHNSYWSDKRFLRYVLSQTYGSKYLQDQPYEAPAAWKVTVMAFLSAGFWALVTFRLAWSLLYGAYGALRDSFSWLVEPLVDLVVFLLGTRPQP